MNKYRGGYGWLVAILPGDKVVYKQETKSGDTLFVYGLSDHDLLFSLTPPEGKRWRGVLSVCAHPTTGWIAVTEHRDDTLDIYNEQGKCMVTELLWSSGVG
jgi:hypothetical protein